MRATYAAAQIIAIGAEVTAAGIYLAFWWPNIPQWIWLVSVSAALVALNSMQVNRLGEFEYWFAMIKVAAIVAFILVGLSLIFGLGIFGAGSRQAIGLANLTQHGGFFPAGWKGVWLSLTITVTSYMGVEIIAVTAGEAQNPRITIPRAMRNIVYRLIGFYVLAIAIMVTMVPWNQAGGSSTLSGSPFVTAFAAAHIPFAAAIMNFVVLTAALSSVNTNLYLSTRMLFSLGRGNYAPRWVGKVSRNGVPHRALLVSTAGIIAAILLAIFAPKNAFLMLYGTAVAGMLFVWLVILHTHLRFRKAITTSELSSLPMRLRAHPFFTVTGILLLLAISVTTFFVDGLQWSFPAFSVFLHDHFAAVPAKPPARIVNIFCEEIISMVGASGEVYSSLRTKFKGDLLRPGDSNYEDARPIWNGMFDRMPALIARCADISDIQSAIRAAAAMDILTAVRCGGHSLAGFGTCDGGMVIDLSRMRADRG